MPAGANALIEWTLLPDVSTVLGESPVWDGDAECFWWVDIEGRKLLRTALTDMTTESWRMPEMAGFVVLTSCKIPAIGMETGIFLFDPATGALERVVEIDEPGIRFNDATVDGFGRLWAGTMDLEGRAGRGALYAIGSDRQPETALEGMHIPNGLAFDPNRNRLYLSDSGSDIRTVWSFLMEPDTGSLRQRGEFAVFADDDGKPDGAALDAQGNYWSAAILGSALRVFSPEGERIGAFAMPYRDPTKPAFGGTSLDRLFVTSRGGTPRGGGVAIASSTQAVPFQGQPAHRWHIAA